MASRARWAAMCSYFLVLCLLGLVGFLIMQTERAPMPREEIAALAGLAGGGLGSVPWPPASLTVSALPGAFESHSELEAFVRRLGASLGEDAVVTATAEPSQVLARHFACVAAVDFAARDCLESFEAEGAGPAAAASGGAALASGFELLVVPAQGCPALLLDAGRGAVLRRAAPLLDHADLAAEVASQLRRTWLRRLHLEHAAALFEVAPAYVLSFFLVGDCHRRISWDFVGGVLTPFLQRFLGRLGQLVDLEVDSQVVTCSSLGGPVGSRLNVTKAKALQADFLRHAGEWPGDTLTRGASWLPPLVRMVAFSPTSPLDIVDFEGQHQTSFAVQGWGVVAVAAPVFVQEFPRPGDADCSKLSACAAEPGAFGPCEAQRVASAWVSHLRSWLTLPPDAPVPDPPGDGADCRGSEGELLLWAAKPRLDGITEWELLLAARAMHALFVQRAVETLENFLALVDSLPDVVVRAEIADTYSQAAAGARQAVSEAASGDLAGALVAARRALALALAISHDDTVVAAMYFSWEFKYAVYLPLCLPIAMPICIGLWRQLKNARAARSLLRRGGGASEVS